MITFTVALVALVLGYFLYGKFVERVFAPDNRVTPAVRKCDNVDFIPMKPWKIFMIQFLNIAGLGPIFGAIMGAKFGTASYLWIVFGCIFAGAMHDYVAGMISMRHDGESLPGIVGRYLGVTTKNVMIFFTMVLMMLVAAVFVSGPAGLLQNLTPISSQVWIYIIFGYYVLATLLPIDKVIGKVYPLFAIALIFMAVGILIMLYVKMPALPELTDGLANTHPKADELPIFPIMFISIACGAISGFHATQSPMMARCMKNERLGRPIFYGAMVAEGIVALIWAAAASYYYSENGMGENNAAIIVDHITREWMGPVGFVLAMLGVIAAPITTGDTALRSARLIAADFFSVNQSKITHRIAVAVPIFMCSIGVLIYSIQDAQGFDVIWRYFSWANQLLSCFTLWACTSFFARRAALGRCGHWYDYLFTFLPALFMTMVCASYICIAPEGFQLSATVSYTIGAVVTAALAVWFYAWQHSLTNK